MKISPHFIVAVTAASLLAVMLIAILNITQSSDFQADAYQADVDEKKTTFSEIQDKNLSRDDLEGHETLEDWAKALSDLKTSTNDRVNHAREELGRFPDADFHSISDDLDRVSDMIASARMISDCNAVSGELNSIESRVSEFVAGEQKKAEEAAAAAQEEASEYSENEYEYVGDNGSYQYDQGYYPSGYSYPSDGLTPFTGVNNYDGQLETYYSSNVLYHQDTSNWTVDDEGFYRTDEGYYVVAANDGQYSYGDTYEGSKGTCQVLDSGCAYGTTDYYVNW